VSHAPTGVQPTRIFRECSCNGVRNDAGMSRYLRLTKRASGYSRPRQGRTSYVHLAGSMVIVIRP